MGEVGCLHQGYHVICSWFPWFYLPDVNMMWQHVASFGWQQNLPC